MADTAGQIAGTVTRASGKTPIEGIEVCAFSETVEFGECVKTSSDGKYEITGLPSGEYFVEFESPFESGLDYVFEYYNDASSFAAASGVEVLAGGTTSGIDAELEEGARISGTVTSALPGKAPLEGIIVCASPKSTSLERGGCAKTDANGKYTVAGLASGEYEVEFSAAFFGGEHKYITQYYNGKKSRSEAQAVPVTAPDTTSGIDAAMQLVSTLPVNTTPPVVSGTPVVGGLLLCGNGLWTGTPTPVLSEQWTRDGVAIPGATGNSYVVQAADEGHSVACRVTAKNASGEKNAYSTSLAIPAPPSPPPPPPPAKPVVKVTGSKIVVSGHLVKVHLECSAAACQGSTKLTVQVVAKHRKGKKTVSHKETLVLASGSFSLAVGKSATIELHLTSAGRKRLAHAKHHPVTVKLELSVKGGSTITKLVSVS